jgi:hypothetical protein
MDAAALSLRRVARAAKPPSDKKSDDKPAPKPSDTGRDEYDDDEGSGHRRSARLRAKREELGGGPSSSGKGAPASGGGTDATHLAVDQVAGLLKVLSSRQFVLKKGNPPPSMRAGSSDSDKENRAPNNQPAPRHAF